MKIKELKQKNVLSDELLDGVSGGSSQETSDDSKFLNVLLQGRPGKCDRYGTWRAGCNKPEIVTAWASVGIKAVLNDHSMYQTISNEYYLNGKQISRDEAWAHAEQVVGRHLAKSEWDW
jgi:hypothetical protein